MGWQGSFILLLLPFTVSAQFVDNFADSNYTANPVWEGDTAKFEITPTPYLLHLNAPPVTDTAYLQTPSQAINNATWEFYVELDFNPSSANYARIYLVADKAKLDSSLNGYFVMVGNTSDEVSLYRQDGTTTTEIIDGADGTTNLPLVTVRIHVSRDSIGNWELLDDTTGGFGFVSEGTATDSTWFATQYFGVYCNYTSTRSDKFYFDDFLVTGQPYVDVSPPVVQGLQVLSSTELDVSFNEYLDIVSAETTANYSANNGIGTPATATRDGTDSSLVHLTFGTSFPNGIWSLLTVSGVQDLSNNAMAAQADSFLFFTYQPVAVSDVVINEIMADKSPAVGLPEAEYLELHNRSSKVFDLYNWTITDGTTTGNLPSHFLLPGSYMILCSPADSISLSNYGTTLPASSWPSLNDAGDSLVVKDSTGQIVNRVIYSNQWYRDNAKDNGGWSLELVNPFDSCKREVNWIASNHPDGGTPGAQNSVYDTTPDTEGPQLLSAELISADTLLLVFDEPIDTGSIGNGIYATSPSLPVLSITMAAADNRQWWMAFANPADSGTVYSLTLSGFTDCPGNLMSQGTGFFLLPFNGRPGDVVINEVLFNPVAGGADFVELYNSTNKPISLRNWKLANYDDDTIAHLETISPDALVMEEGTFIVCTEDSDNVKTNYPLSQTGTFVQLNTLPTYRDDSSTVFLVNDKDEVMERFSYTDSMHFALLNDKEGKSLERLDATRPSSDPTNWHTASQSIGFATPGYENSQHNPSDQIAEAVSVNPEVFSPDNDGMDDVLNINYQFDQPGYVANITVFDAKGRLIRLLTRNELLGITGTISWDGTNEAGEKARVGAYVIYFEVFNLNGKVLKFKKACVVAARL